MTFDYLIGIDEVGRGPIAGPLCVGACALVRGSASLFYKKARGIKDSKQLLPKARDRWADTLHGLESKQCIRLATTLISESEIDAGGLALALRDATKEVLKKLKVAPVDSFIFLDGTLRAPEEFLFQESIIGGDETDALIAAASIIAKVRRDRLMVEFSKSYPEYGFDVHKGYGTRSHYAALHKYGPCEVHRRSFLSKFEARNPKS